MTNEFKVELFFDNSKPTFQSIMNKLYKDYLRTNLELIALNNEKSYNTSDKKVLASNEEVE